MSRRGVRVKLNELASRTRAPKSAKVPLSAAFLCCVFLKKRVLLKSACGRVTRRDIMVFLQERLA